MSIFPPDTETKYYNYPCYHSDPTHPALWMVRRNVRSDFEGTGGGHSAAMDMKAVQDEAREAFCKSAVDFIIHYKQLGSETEADRRQWAESIKDMANIYFEHEMQPLSIPRQTQREEALENFNAIKVRCVMPSSLSEHRILGGNVLNNFHEFIKLAKEAQAKRLPFLNQRGLRIEPYMFKEMALAYASLSGAH
jgi:hypothetical protein